ncbi:MAG TPA: hypothetical protein VFZ55_07135 [Nitrososphaera sp.]
MIHLNNDKNNNNRTIPAATIFTLAIIIMTISTIAAPAATTTTTATTMPQPVTVATDNQSVNVLISWEPMEIEPGQDTEFTLDFQDPSSGESISHVNYNFEIIDQNNGETVESMTDLHTHSGSDEQTMTFDTAGSFNVVATIIGTGIDPPFDTTQSGTAQTVITVGQQLAGATGGNNTAGRTDSITATTGGATGAQSACDPTQMAGGGGTNATAGNATTATNATMTANATTAGGGNQTTSSPTQLIEQACIAALNNDTQGVLMNLNLALNALGGNMTTTADDDDDEGEEGGEEEEGEGGEAG